MIVHMLNVSTTELHYSIRSILFILMKHMKPIVLLGVFFGFVGSSSLYMFCIEDIPNNLPFKLIHHCFGKGQVPYPRHETRKTWSFHAVK